MSGQRGKVAGLLCRVVAITALTFFLALPETVRAHSDIDTVGAEEHELSPIENLMTAIFIQFHRNVILTC